MRSFCLDHRILVLKLCNLLASHSPIHSNNWSIQIFILLSHVATLWLTPGKTSNLLINYSNKHLFCSRLTVIYKYLIKQSFYRVYVIFFLENVSYKCEGGINLWFLRSNFLFPSSVLLSNIPVHYPDCQFWQCPVLSPIGIITFASLNQKNTF